MVNQLQQEKVVSSVSLSAGARLHLRGLTRELGWFDSSLYLLSKAFNWISRGKMEMLKYYFVSQPVLADALLPKGRGQSIEVRFARQDERLVASFPRPASIIRQRFQAGAECLVALKDGNFVGFLWLQRGSYLEDEVRCRFTPLPPESTAWDFDVHVEPRYRNSVVFARLWDTSNRHLQNQGIQWSVSRISAFNPGSINAHVRLGAFPIGAAYFFLIGQWQCLLTSSKPYVHISLSMAKLPEIIMSADCPKKYVRFRELS